MVRVSGSGELCEKVAGVEQFFLERGGLQIDTSLKVELPWEISRSKFSIDEKGTDSTIRVVRPLLKNTLAPPPVLLTLETS